jgi:hypothetical protein
MKIIENCVVYGGNYLLGFYRYKFNNYNEERYTKKRSSVAKKKRSNLGTGDFSRHIKCGYF